MNEEQVIKSLAALAHPVRLRVFRALVVAGTQGLTPSVLVEQLEVAATALSFHLKELVNASLARHHGSWAAAARELQIDRANLQRLAKRLDIARP